MKYYVQEEKPLQPYTTAEPMLQDKWLLEIKGKIRVSKSAD